MRRREYIFLWNPKTPSIFLNSCEKWEVSTILLDLDMALITSLLSPSITRKNHLTQVIPDDKTNCRTTIASPATIKISNHGMGRGEIKKLSWTKGWRKMAHFTPLVRPTSFYTLLQPHYFSYLNKHKWLTLISHMYSLSSVLDSYCYNK